MRAVLVLGVLTALCVPADAATVHRSKPSHPSLSTRQPAIVRPDPAVRAPARFSVPGWTDEQTQQWLDNATSCDGCG